ncbi:hypothetical protein FC15_GL000733 [Lapidilactobacillus concavus DSM 17758]|uniref:Uncharacterized protein n=1 Tax=Lapidilactobacillus concavus DSM 17758 TaxID=1423735 RepID=A0A0R1VYX7_9LACO|nr:hypothetical protein FC15_GL000733 [Lapidilactobacillus concavus DSM 17758]
MIDELGDDLFKTVDKQYSRDERHRNGFATLCFHYKRRYNVTQQSRRNYRRYF